MACWRRKQMNFHWLTASTLQVYGKLLWPLKKLLVTPAPAVEQTSAFLHLPIDILCCICDELPLSAKILLSRTCKAMWYMLRSKCSFQLKAIGWKDRFNTLTDLGNLLPDNYHCIKCNILHRVEPHDIPNLTKFWYRRRHSCRIPNQRYDHVHPQDSYAVSFHHVQLALKYSRMKEKHQDCRRNILQNFEIRPAGSPIIKTFAAKPKVVNARFILLATYVLYAGPLRDAAKRDYDKHIMFCPHHHFGIGTGPCFSFAAMLQKAAINAATMQDQHTELFSCDRCPTDFSLVVQDDEAVLEAWHDLGNGLSLEDPSWQSHLYSYGHNGVSRGPQFNYEHGSISKMYNSCYS